MDATIEQIIKTKIVKNMSNSSYKIVYLEFSEEKSHKFYEIRVQNNQLILRFGRIGDKGQIKTELYATSEETTQQAEKKINEKLKKGYKFAVLGETPKKEIERKDESFEIQPEQNNLEINYTGLSLINSPLVKFRYRLEG